MAVNTAGYNQNLSANTSRGPSPSIWNDCPVFELLEQKGDYAGGMYFMDDFVMTGQLTDATSAAQVNNMGQWGVYSSIGGLLADGALEGGVISIGSDADDESVTLASLAGAFQMITATTFVDRKKLWFECRVGFSTIATAKMDCFIGLADKLVTSNLLVNAIPITTTADTLSTTPNRIGFHKKSGASTEINFAFAFAGDATTYPTNLTTLMNTVTGAVLVAQSGQATGWVKLGFVYDPAAPDVMISSASSGQTVGAIKKQLLRVFVNGQAAPAFLTSTNVNAATFPVGPMGPVISCMQTGTGSNKLLVDWIRVAQLPSY